VVNEMEDNEVKVYCMDCKFWVFAAYRGLTSEIEACKNENLMVDSYLKRDWSNPSINNEHNDCEYFEKKEEQIVMVSDKPIPDNKLKEIVGKLKKIWGK
jgi:hypothetical protein